MITHRAYRDIEKCEAKYGEAWKEYTRRVPYLFIPVCQAVVPDSTIGPSADKLAVCVLACSWRLYTYASNIKHRFSFCLLLIIILGQDVQHITLDTFVCDRTLSRTTCIPILFAVPMTSRSGKGLVSRVVDSLNSYCVIVLR